MPGLPWLCSAVFHNEGEKKNSTFEKDNLRKLKSLVIWVALGIWLDCRTDCDQWGKRRLWGKEFGDVIQDSVPELSLLLCTNDAVLAFILRSCSCRQEAWLEPGYVLVLADDSRFFVPQPWPLSVGWEEGTLPPFPLSPTPGSSLAWRPGDYDAAYIQTQPLVRASSPPWPEL